MKKRSLSRLLLGQLKTRRSTTGGVLMAAIDARMICPIIDQHGGVVIYESGRPAYYLLDGEWYVGLSDNRSEGRLLTGDKINWVDSGSPEVESVFPVDGREFFV